MYRIKTLNRISDTGLAVLDRNLYEIGDSVEQEDGLLVRSAAMHDYVFPESLCAIARAGAGTNNIPLERCAEAGIVVFNTPGANANAVKELVLCALLLSSRKISAGIAWAKEQAAGGAELDKVVEKGKGQFEGPELLGKTLGVVGLGAIGRLVANAALSFGMSVCGYDPFLSVQAALALDPRVKVFDAPEPLLQNCDYLTLHIPLNDQTRGFLDAAAISQMKDGVRIINMARGGLVDETALLNALDQGKTACYVTDFPSSGLIGRKNAVCIPHLGASTPESEENCARMAAQELDAYLRTGNIKNSVNLPNLQKDWTAPARICVLRHTGTPSDGLISLLGQKEMPVEAAEAVRGGYAYTILDMGDPNPDAIAAALQDLEGVIRIRVLTR